MSGILLSQLLLQVSCLHDLFVEKVVASPSSIAISDSLGEMSYIELFSSAYSLAISLEEYNINPEDIIAIRLPKGRQQVIVTLAIMMAGAAYLPLESDWPDERCINILKKSKSKLIITDDIFDTSDRHNIDLIFISLEKLFVENSVSLEVAKNFVSKQSTENLAYVIFTSGSTGTPKGVAIEHASVVNTVIDINQKYGVTSSDRILAISSLSFDLSVFDFFGLLAAGGTIVFPLDQKSKDPIHWLSQVKSKKITIWNTVPISAGLLIDQCENDRNLEGCDLRVMMLSGDWISPNLPARVWDFFPECMIYSLGGATEGSIWSIHFPVDFDTSKLNSIPYGKALGEQSFYVMNNEFKLCPIGVIGELYIGGKGVARGYFEDEELTSKQFIWCDELRQRLYRTGDLGRYLQDGNIEFVGRKDNQVKIRGFRVELNEIESQISIHPDVSDVVVLTKCEGPDLIRLIAYCTVLNNKISEGKLKEFLYKKLPEYMVPNLFCFMDEIPQTANGKLDRKALLALDTPSCRERNFVPPNNLYERMLAEIWSELLMLPNIGRGDNFFELGGHSLLAIRMVTKVVEKGFSLNVQDVFASSSLGDLASNLMAHDKSSLTNVDNLIPENASLILPDMINLIILSEKELLTISKLVPGGFGNIKDLYPLTQTQEGFLYHHISGEGYDPYVLPNIVTLKNRGDFENFIEALNFIVHRHDALRTLILWKRLNRPVQVVLREVAISVEYLLIGKCDSAQDTIWRIYSEGPHFLELDKAPLLKVKVVVDSDGRHIALLQFHHMVIDHIGIEVLKNELSLYLAGHAQQLSSPVQYRYFVASYLQQMEICDYRSYFSELLGDVDEPTLAYGLEDLVSGGGFIDDYNIALPDDTSLRIREACKNNKISSAAFFHSVWALVVSLCSGRDDIVFGSVLSGRMQADSRLGNMIGLTINTLPVRVNLDGKSARQLVSDVHSILASLVAYEYTPLVLAQHVVALVPILLYSTL